MGGMFPLRAASLIGSSERNTMPTSMNPSTGKVSEFEYTPDGRKKYEASLKAGNVPVRGKTARAMNQNESAEGMLRRPLDYGGE